MNVRPDRKIHLLEKVLYPIARAINGAGTVVLGVMVLLTVADVLLRLFLDRPIRGAFEIVEFLMVMVVFSAMAYTGLLRGHIVIQILSSRLPERPRAILDSIADLISIGFCCLLIWQGIAQAQMTRLHNDISGVLSIPVSPFYYVLVLGMALMGLVFLANLLDSVGRWAKK
ncbi:MAG: C4-dicarboxylate transporter permease [Deltaproteobacteria bacterium]|jgi:TRAP-type C4-dicarboxylate transport system permease small subunit|nr:C4-dicarboxylate transporter permease [Deltaproteobacteria bacterium]